MREEELLINRLAEYGKTDMYPFHMPGHKRQGFRFPNPFEVDITEIEGFDNLHHPEGVLKESMEWAASIYGADKTYYLINGSSCGILAAVCGCTARGGRILMSRNCHKAAYHAVYVNELQAEYVYPQEIGNLGIQGGILAGDVEKRLKEYADIQAVLVVSPTYDGCVSDIGRIAGVVHEAGLPLIVDEAHGAHFRYGKGFPQSALELGADVVIQSVHKTLPSLTQTALLHLKNNRPDGGFYGDARKLERMLSIYQSSSPSYVLMASIENSIFQMERLRAQKEIERYMEQLLSLRKRLEGLKLLRLVGRELTGRFGIFDMDCSKVVISTRETNVNGAWLSEELRREFHLEMEMCGADYVTAISSVCDSEEGLKRLGDALLAIDGRLEAQACLSAGGSCIYSVQNEAVLPICRAMDSPLRGVSLSDSAGYISGEFAYIYPPGIPILAPGERISGQVLAVILDYISKGLPVQGLVDGSLKTIQVVEE